MRVFKLAAAAAVVTLLVSPAALAQQRGGSVVVVNSAQLLQQTALGRDMATKLNAVATQLQQEETALQPVGEAIQRDLTAFQTAARGKTPAQISADPTLGPQQTALQTRLQQFQGRQQGLQGDFECTRAMALRDFSNTTTPAVRTAMTAHGATVAIDASNAVFFDPSVDITSTVMQALDASSRTATVTLHRVAECQPAQQGAAQH